MGRLATAGPLGSGKTSSGPPFQSCAIGYGRIVVRVISYERDKTLDHAHLLRIANWLSKAERGNAVVDCIIHQALGRPDLMPPPYTTDVAVAQELLPAKFEWLDPVHVVGMVYARCRRIGLDGDLQHPHSSQWGRTLALAMCGAAIRGHIIARE